MNNLARLRHAEQRITKVQRRIWLAQLLTWPTIVVAAVLTLLAIVWLRQRRSAGGRHEMPDLPGAHEAASVDGQAGTGPAQP